MAPMAFNSVLLPEPEGPSSPTTSPDETAQGDVAQRIDPGFAFTEVLGYALELDQRT